MIWIIVKNTVPQRIALEIIVSSVLNPSPFISLLCCEITTIFSLWSLRGRSLIGEEVEQ